MYHASEFTPKRQWAVGHTYNGDSQIVTPVKVVVPHEIQR